MGNQGRISDTPPMAHSRPALRWSALVGLWSVVGAVLWITAVQFFLLALNPFCHLQRPGITQVVVVSVDKDPNSQLTDYVTARQGDEERVLTMTKAEAANLHTEAEYWVLDAWYADGLRPTQFRLSLERLLLEYPALLLLPAAWGLWRVRKARQKADAAPPPPVLRVFTDDFHLRAQRFNKGADSVDAAPTKVDEKPLSR